jgi:pyruvate/2-oxoglutarate dehydrogenase complex dihydrolipoamide dehydrogenase (E3) component
LLRRLTASFRSLIRASAVLRDRFKREGVKVVVDAPVEHVERAGHGIALTAAGRRIDGDALLVAVGRRPRLDELNLERAGVAFSKDGISAGSTLRTSNPRIYAAGDAAGSMQFTHYAGWQGYVAARNALFPGAMRGTREGVPWVVFTDPEVGKVGLTDEEARRRGWPIEVLRLPLERIDRAQTTGELDGFIKLVTHNDTLVGATVVAPVAGEVINELALAIQSKVPCVSSARRSTSIRRTGSAFSNWPGRRPLPGSSADGKAGWRAVL